MIYSVYLNIFSCFKNLKASEDQTPVDHPISRPNKDFFSSLLECTDEYDSFKKKKINLKKTFAENFCLDLADKNTVQNLLSTFDMIFKLSECISLFNIVVNWKVAQYFYKYDKCLYTDRVLNKERCYLDILAWDEEVLFKMLANHSLFGRKRQVFKITIEKLINIGYLCRISIYIYEIHDIAKNHVLRSVNSLSADSSYSLNVRRALKCLAGNAQMIVDYLESRHNLGIFHSETVIRKIYGKCLNIKAG